MATAKKAPTKKHSPQPKNARGTTESRDKHKVPEWAENMEHSLRRLIRERERARAKSPGMYL